MQIATERSAEVALFTVPAKRKLPLLNVIIVVVFVVETQIPKPYNTGTKGDESQSCSKCLHTLKARVTYPASISA